MPKLIDKYLGKLRQADFDISSISDSHIFVDNTARDTYFTTNPTEKETGVFIAVGDGFQQWSGTAWVDKSAVVKGEKGDKGDQGDPGPKGDQGDQGEPGTATSKEILQGTKSEIVSPNEQKPYLTRKPIISWVSDDAFGQNLRNWLTVFEQSFGTVNTPKGCLALVSDWLSNHEVLSASLTDATTISFNAVTQEITDSAENFLDPAIDPPIEVNSVIHIQGSLSNNTYFVVKEVAAGVIKVYTNSGNSGWGAQMVTEVNPGTTEVTIHRGNLDTLPLSDMMDFVNAGWEIQAHSRTHRCMSGARSGYDTPNDEELWTEVFDSKRILEEKLGVEVTNFVYPFGTNNQRAREFIQQAGYRTARAYGTNGPGNNKFINYDVIQPFNLESPFDNWNVITEANALVGTCSMAAGTSTIVGDGTDFTHFSDGDLVVLHKTINESFVRRVVGTPTATEMTVDKIFHATTSFSGHSVYDPTLEVFDADAQTGIALINNAVLNNGWLIWTTHSAPSIPTGYTKMNTIFEYGNYLNIDFLTVEDALEYYDTLMNIGGAVSISEKGMALNNAESEIFTLNAQRPVKLGYRAGILNEDQDNVFIGYFAGLPNKAQDSVMIGGFAGWLNEGARNVFIGRSAGSTGNKGSSVAIGASAGSNSTGINTVFIGDTAGQNSTGSFGTAIGQAAGRNNTGTFLCLIGYEAGNKSALGATNSLQAFGYKAGKNSVGYNNVFIGNLAGENYNGNNTFLLESRGASPDNPLIKGFFDTRAIILGAPATAVADAQMGVNSVSLHLDEAANKLHFKVKYADGTTIKTGEVALV